MLVIEPIAAMLRPSLLSCRVSKISNLGFRIAALAIVLGFFGATARAQTAPGSRYDVSNYRIEVQLNPNEHTLRAFHDNPDDTEEAQITFVSALTASAFGLATTGSIDYGWSSFENAFKNGIFFNGRKK